ncbi:hypothetical protein H6G96_28055 [Nostoc sp. FACHB-892]|uniref:hypothetical protein n=1 Tax=Nostoc sp. FACHB-892 TaxID=2692843 RepID=UPI0016840711|nr:hypothetical protein [Nostoc sp. FACHB-892]MBD2730067.1 hypothetical protein [Nostoc sp. FACHB-892]
MAVLKKLPNKKILNDFLWGGHLAIDVKLRNKRIDLGRGNICKSALIFQLVGCDRFEWSNYLSA